MNNALRQSFDLKLVDEAEHLIPRPVGTLQSLNLDHLHRYAFAKSFCYNANVLDAAMGCGYSSLILNCRHYTGVDIDANMVAFANQYYKPMIPNANYLQGDVCDLKVADTSIDTFISFETIEHLPVADIAKYFAEVKRVLRPGGTFLCSTPIYRGDKIGLLTRYHTFEFRFGQFEATLLNNGFQIQEICYQWPPHFTIQSVIPTALQTQQPAPYIVVCVCRVSG
jgi:ubiquinone/menaquinone biosynthesis C-methylase UbiE